MNIYILNTLSIGQDMIDFVSRGIRVKGIIGLSDREPGDAISDFAYQKEFCEKRSIEFIEVDSYTLNKGEDKQKLLGLDIDVLIISGWQRLIPSWLINHCKVCAIGGHGSPLGITKGRGRSPQNWALMLGMDTFHISIFKVDPGVDSGEIIDTRTFTYSVFDDIRTSYYKASLLNAEMIVSNLSKPDFKELKFTPQSHEDAEYFPQRLPEDGKIDWNLSNAQLRNFVRALTKPYPGAETNIKGAVVKIWSLIPFDVDSSIECKNGTIVKIFNNQELLVKTKESFVLVNDYESTVTLEEGDLFESASFEMQLQAITNRHTEKYPDMKISEIFSKRSS
jgi:UDP-4-amino-4-deoxy-L-arabinose formyltransferase/UDP-glucuronic acid dehydrogenase (UDP-4-keto-hexauronic acid decarboxylating)